MKYRVIIWLALLCFVCPLAALPAEGLQITGCEAVTVFGEPPYILLTYEYPQDFEKSGEEITVNGHKAFYDSAGGGFGDGKTFESWIVYVGGPGPKQINVTVRSGGRVLRAAQTMDFRSEGDVLLLDRTDGEAILSRNRPGESATQCHFFGYFFKDLKMELNGGKLAYHLEPIKAPGGHFLISCRPDLRQGENTVALTWQSATGRPRVKRYHFYLAKDGVVKQGDTIKVRLGRLASKSGPFYRAAVKGNCLEIEKGASLARQVVLRKGFYLSQDLIDLAIFKAKQPGNGVIEIYKKEIFFNPYEIDRRLDVTVVH